jgi:two-component system, response regulator, stage 0 sporulation protein F
MGELLVILVADDDDDVRRTIAQALETLAYDVAEAPDGDSAMAIFREQSPELVILDYRMPGKNGVEVAEEMRRVRPDIPIIMASGFAEEAELGQRVGKTIPVLHKPFRLGELADLINAAL